ncbi:hypothetical protein HanIR_Chr06g0284411 [Helianthus annuus]|nr:hypothetical protein HanIR_Chr06g0284411 [Helianthus annuus]
MIKNKKALLKKSFDMFTVFDHETTKQTIDRYCHLVLEMGRLDIKKEDDEWVDKLAKALPQHKWGTYLMVVKLMRKSESMNLAQFIQKIEEQELDIQKTAIMTNPNAKQDVSLYYRGNKFEATPSQSPKISTAFSADVLQVQIQVLQLKVVDLLHHSQALIQTTTHLALKIKILQICSVM